MSQLIDDLLNLSRGSRGELRKDPVDLAELARQIADDLRRGEPERRVDFAIADELRANGNPRLLRAALEWDDGRALREPLAGEPTQPAPPDARERLAPRQ